MCSVSDLARYKVLFSSEYGSVRGLSRFLKSCCWIDSVGARFSNVINSVQSLGFCMSYMVRFGSVLVRLNK